MVSRGGRAKRYVDRRRDNGQVAPTGEPGRTLTGMPPQWHGMEAFWAVRYGRVGAGNEPFAASGGEASSQGVSQTLSPSAQRFRAAISSSA